MSLAFHCVNDISVSEPQIPSEEDVGSSDVQWGRLSYHNPTGTLRTFSEDLDPEAMLSLNAPEAMASQLVCEVPMPRDHLGKNQGKEGCQESATHTAHLTRQDSAAGEPRAALSC